MKIRIIARKHDNSFHRSWERNVILKESNTEIIGINNRTVVINSDLSTFKTTNRALFYFSKENWFNIIHIDDYENPYYYCNLSSPYVIDQDKIIYIDYDIDIQVDQDFNYQILDLKEFELNKGIYNYSDQLEHRLMESMNDLISMIENKESIFSKDVLNAYYKLYEQI